MYLTKTQATIAAFALLALTVAYCVGVLAVVIML